MAPDDLEDQFHGSSIRSVAAGSSDPSHPPNQKVERRPATNGVRRLEDYIYGDGAQRIHFEDNPRISRLPASLQLEFSNPRSSCTDSLQNYMAGRRAAVYICRIGRVMHARSANCELVEPTNFCENVALTATRPKKTLTSPSIFLTVCPTGAAAYGPEMICAINCLGLSWLILRVQTCDIGPNRLLKKSPTSFRR